MARFVLWGTYCSDALDKRAPFREEHLSRLQSLKQQGTLITLGPTEGSTHVFGIFEAENLVTVQELVKQDIYWTEGIWTAVEVYPWIQRSEPAPRSSQQRQHLLRIRAPVRIHSSVRFPRVQ